MLKIYPRGAGGDGEGWVLQGTGEKIVICVWESYIRLVTGWKGEIAEDRQDRLVPTIEALIEIQKRTLSTLGTVTGRFDKIDMEMTKITRQGLKLESELASFRSDATARLDAIGRRLEELEQLADQNATDIREAKSEILTQQNEILNAMQAGLDYRSAINDIKERLAELERRVGL